MAVVYFAFAFSAFGFARGSGKSSSGPSADITARLMQTTAGTIALIAAALVIIAVGGYLCAALGWAPREFAAIGVPIRERAKRFEEIITVMRHLWSSDQPLNFNGKYYSFDQVRMVSQSERPGGIPIWIGASSSVGVRRAARLGDAWLGSSHTPIEDLASFSARFDEALAAEGRVIQRRPLLRHCMVAETDELATERFVNAFEAYYRALGDWGIFKEVVGERHSIENSDSSLPPGRAIVGSPETVIEQIAEYQRLGFNEIVFQVGLPGTPEPFVHESLELLGHQVLPRLLAKHMAPVVGGLSTRKRYGDDEDLHDRLEV